ncbi:hypothetical protein GUJ93_ZPchr0013g37617 [Zizania palustris]|uniref:Polygalacturonase n=1 Tax=Zizania palustris TaxID=103762 RepID=A0A8J5X406_ZIZPA|nr:hypothetical protein GUJ93_ZPchr0013g36476 [Zizania palustris]KAG8096997.1 hypothetical protein GUJ93_ZPchr0013g37617 [Zizania palustris]
MGPKMLHLSSITTISIFFYMFVLHVVDGTYGPEAEGPTTAESSDLDELQLSPAPSPRIVYVDDYRARADDAGDHTERASAGNLQALYFRRCTHLVVEGLRIRDSMQMHVAIAYSWKVHVSRLLIAAPAWSPNTDGIHVSNSREVLISDCIISTGDDCISIVTGSMFVQATGIFCGPGHGISIGSLGANKSWAHVSDVLVERATLVGTTNGVRIKTWQGGGGFAERITFQDISMHNVTNPVIIDQNYCDSKSPCHEQGSAVAINNIRYRNIRGTSSSRLAISFVCSNSVHCDGIVMQDVSLVGEGTYVSCYYMNARVLELGYNFPYCRAEM